MNYFYIIIYEGRIQVATTDYDKFNELRNNLEKQVNFGSHYLSIKNYGNGTIYDYTRKDDDEE